MSCACRLSKGRRPNLPHGGISPIAGSIQAYVTREHWQEAAHCMEPASGAAKLLFKLMAPEPMPCKSKPAFQDATWKCHESLLDHAPSSIASQLSMASAVPSSCIAYPLYHNIATASALPRLLNSGVHLTLLECFGCCHVLAYSSLQAASGHFLGAEEETHHLL